MSPSCLLVIAFCVSQMNEPRTCSIYGDMCEDAGYRLASVLVKGAGKMFGFTESAEIHTGQRFPYKCY